MKKRNILMSFLSLGILASCALPELPNMSFDFGNLTSSKNNNEDSKVTIFLKTDGGFFDNGKEDMEITVQFNEPIGYLPIPRRDGYLFVGWVDSQGNMYDETISFKEDITLYAKWEEHIHEYIQDNMSIMPTCTENGVIYEKCRTCGEETKYETPALGHQYGDSIVVIAPTCESMGYERKQCEMCLDEVINTLPALGHDIENMTVITPQTCTQGGECHGICSRCGQDKEIYTEPLGHKMAAYIEPFYDSSNGTAQTIVKACVNGCGTSELAFRPDQVTSNSAPHLVFNEDGGARFFGQPIGNNVELNMNGDADSGSHEPIFDVTQTGDYFEYAFNLTSEQVAKLGSSQRLYCGARAASYMSSNRMDFWARKEGEAADWDWTPGYYVEGEHIGEFIEGYRYILYVDDQPQSFDPTITNPVTGSNTNQPIKEYVMPYTFHLHEGLNKIRLHMAGGYRSTFYNFTFRSYADPNESQQNSSHEHTPVVGAKASNSALRPLACTCNNYAGYELQAADLTVGQKNPSESGHGTTEKATRLGKGVIFDDVWNIEGITAGQYDLYMKARAFAGNSNSGYWNSETAIINGDSAPNNGDSTDYKYKVKVGDGEFIPVGNDVDNYASTGLNEETPAWTNKSLARITISGDATSLTIHNMNNGYSLWVYAIRLIKIV